MKKIMIIAVLMLASTVASAASFKWSAANIYDHTGTAKYTGEVTLYAYLASADVSTAVAVSTVTASSTGAVPATTFSDDVNFVAGKEYNFFFVASDGSYEFTSATKGPIGAQATSTATVAFGNMSSATQASGAWAAVPEPTSGILLLLGMAGLALRRKQK